MTRQNSAKIAKASWEEFGSPSLDFCRLNVFLRGSPRGILRGLALQALAPQKAPQGNRAGHQKKAGHITRSILIPQTGREEIWPSGRSAKHQLG